MSPVKAVLGAAATGAGLLLYGALFEARRLSRERHTLRLPRWPADRAGYRVGLVADIHLGSDDSFRMAREAAEWLVEEDPDVVAVLGDVLNLHRPSIGPRVRECLAPLRHFEGRAFGVWGNHDYCGGTPFFLEPDMAACGVRMLRNGLVVHDGVNWVGVDDGLAGRADPFTPILESDPNLPTVVLWHEGDLVDLMPRGPELMLSGHSHGGQFTLPGGVAPMTSVYGSKYLRGYFPSAPVPLYVSRGVAVTGPPSRLFCKPEVSVLTLVPA